MYIYFDLYFCVIFLPNYIEQISYKSVHAYYIEEDKCSFTRKGGKENHSSDYTGASMDLSLMLD